MLGRNHVATTWGLYTASLGLSSLVATQFTLTPGVYIMSLPALAFGSLLPDIDHPKSIVGRRVPRLSTFLYGEGGKNHRTITHTVWALLVVVWLGRYLVDLPLIGSWSWALPLGYFAHLLEDSFSLVGIDWIYPVPHKKRWREYAYRVGGRGERLFTAGSFVLGLIGLVLLFVHWTW